ncbi:MAG TPA: amino acid permease [Tissierellaceae bacterium]|nr:amino acid permease [Tissierellaceae bacterium]
MQKQNTGSEGELRRNLTLLEGTAYGVSFLVGTGIFLKPSSVLASTNSTGMSLVFWALGGLISLFSALTIAEIASYIPKLGGLYTYITEIYGDLAGFVYGWVEVLVSGPGGAAASAIAFATFASRFISLGNNGVKVLALAVIWFMAATQMLSTKGTMRLQTVGTFAKLIPIALIIALGLAKGGTEPVNFSAIGGNQSVGYGVALLGVLWSYDGWIATCNLGSEMIEPEKNLPKSIIMAILFVMGVYITFNYVVFRMLPVDQIIASESIGIDASQKLFGEGGTTFIIIGMLISSIITLNAQIINGARTYLAMGERKRIIFADFIGHVNPKYDTPVNALIAMTVVASVYIVTGTFESVTNLVVFVVWIFFVMATVGIFKLRKMMPRNDNLYHVPLYPIVPILGVLGGGYLLFSTITSSLTTTMLGACIALIGIPMYYYTKNKYGDHEID